MHMATKTRRWTRTDIDRMPEDGNRYEVVDGALFVSPPPSPEHEGIIYELAALLDAFVRRNAIGAVLSGKPAVVYGDSYVEPDIVGCERPRPFPKKWDDMPRPFLLVEVISPTSWRRDRVFKHTLYTRERVEYWIVDPEARTFTIASPGQPDRVVNDRLTWTPPNSAQTFELDVDAFFRGLLSSA